MKNLKPAFKIYKDGTTTNGPVTILKDDEFNEVSKRAKYEYLGYDIIEL